MRTYSRREFIEFLGRASVASTAGIGILRCGGMTRISNTEAIPFQPIAPTDTDDLVLARGFKYKILLTEGDVITSAGEKIGFNNDFLAFFPLGSHGTESLLWINHESLEPFMFHQGKTFRSKKTIDLEMTAVGGSIVHIKKSGDEWVVQKDSSYNRRINAQTKIPLISEHPIAGSREAIGTLANCAGGVTPWGTVLTCEENFQDFYGEYKYDDFGNKTWKAGKSSLDWNSVYNYSPEHYGWVVEVNPYTGEAKKLIALGRFAHECATTTVGSDHRCVVYTGDDKVGGFIYKFIAANPNSLHTGTLFAADTKNGRWLPLTLENPSLKGKFKNITDLLVRARQAAKWAGATPQDRPEDIEIDPRNQNIYVTLTENIDAGNLYGSILKIEEKNGDPLALEFKSKTFVAGGADIGFSCPDNLAFDPAGNLWMTTDISPKLLNKDKHASFKNNGLFYIPLSGPDAGKAFQVASAPRHAEFTGPRFSPDGKTLFLSVQHPGEKSKSADNLLSHWPRGGQSWPQSAVIQISGPGLNALLDD